MTTAIFHDSDISHGGDPGEAGPGQRRDRRCGQASQISTGQGLNPYAQYVVRVGVGLHCDFIRDFLKRTVKGGLVQSLEVDGATLESELPLPLGGIELDDFDIAQELTGQGGVEIVIRARTKEFPVAGLNTIWLLRKDRMPWRLKLA